jgi:hypothetical protein
MAKDATVEQTRLQPNRLSREPANWAVKVCLLTNELAGVDEAALDLALVFDNTLQVSMDYLGWTPGCVNAFYAASASDQLRLVENYELKDPNLHRIAELHRIKYILLNASATTHPKFEGKNRLQFGV